MKYVYRLLGLATIVLLAIPAIAMVVNYSETGNWLALTDKRLCQARGIAYYKEMDIGPALSDGTPIEIAAYKKCSRSLYAFD